jgi:hypothetical protein
MSLDVWEPVAPWSVLEPLFLLVVLLAPVGGDAAFGPSKAEDESVTALDRVTDLSTAVPDGINWASVESLKLCGGSGKPASLIAFATILCLIASAWERVRGPAFGSISAAYVPNSLSGTILGIYLSGPHSGCYLRLSHTGRPPEPHESSELLHHLDW